MDELMTWANLGTLVGASAAVLLIVQYTKELLPKLHTRLWALIIAFVILQVTTLIAHGTLEQHGIAVLNSFLVATSAMGMYQVTFEKVENKDG